MDTSLLVLSIIMKVVFVVVIVGCCLLPLKSQWQLGMMDYLYVRNVFSQNICATRVVKESSIKYWKLLVEPTTRIVLLVKIVVFHWAAPLLF